MNREQEFARQLEQDSNRISRELLNNHEWEWLRNFYGIHLNEISSMLGDGNPRLVIEDIDRLEPSLKLVLSEHRVFLY